MVSSSRVLRAFTATRALGIPDDEVKPVLKDLLKVYDKNWQLIEEDNYRTLLDAYFELKDNKDLEGRSNDEFERPYKKQHLGEQEDRIAVSSSSHTLAAEEGEKSRRTVELGVMNPSKPCFRDDKIESRLRGNPSKKPRCESPNRKPSSVLAPKVEMPSSSRNIEMSKPKIKELIDILPLSAQSTPLNHPGTKDGASGLGNSEKGSSKKSPICSKHMGSHDQTIVTKKCTSYDENIRLCDVTRGTENVKISLVSEIGDESLPKFNYIPNNIIYQDANVNVSLARISDEDCCSGCSGDCLLSSLPCACARETGGEFAYTPKGLLKEEFLNACMSMRCEPQEHHYFFCHICPIEKLKNESEPDRCNGHLLRKFIKECWRKCGCDMRCGNRVVQRGISCKLQVFLTCEGKGWGLRTVQDLPKGTFVCEYVGEILTNMELYDRLMQSNGNGRHTYPVTLDADWGSEGVLKDEEALCLDATYHGNVARFINHRCVDANLIDIPVEVETPDRHYYHLAFFTTRKVNAFEELSWDYGIDFADRNHPIKAFQCRCESAYCRDRKRKGSSRLKGKKCK